MLQVQPFNPASFGISRNFALHRSKPSARSAACAQRISP